MVFCISGGLPGIIMKQDAKEKALQAERDAELEVLRREQWETKKKTEEEYWEDWNVRNRPGPLPGHPPQTGRWPQKNLYNNECCGQSFA